MAGRSSFSFRLHTLPLVLLVAAVSGAAQEPAQPAGSPSVINGRQPAEQAAAQQAQALKLLDQTVSEAQALRLPENRIRVQFAAGDMLWKHDEAHARSLFSEAAAGLAGMVRSFENNDRQQFGAVAQLRQEMLTVVAQRDPNLALDTLRATRLPQQAQNVPFQPTDPDANLEFRLLTLIAANDPKQALLKAQELLGKGEYSSALLSLLAQLQTKDKEAAAKLTEDMLKGLRAENLTTNQSARNLTFALLQSGPRLAPAAPGGEQKDNTASNNQVLNETAYRELLETAISAALSIVPQLNAPAGLRGGIRGNVDGSVTGRTTTSFTVTSQGNANGMMLLVGVGSLLPQIDKYAPARATLVRQKLSAAGINMEQQAFAREQMNALMQQGTVDSILNAAGQAPPGLQNRLYQQAALKAVDEGNTERARQIANEHLNPDARSQVLRAVERQQIVRALAQGKTEEAQQMLARLQTDDERVDALLQLAALLVKQGEKKPAGQMLEDARNIVARRAENYQQLEAQLRVAQAYAEIEPARSFEILEPGISQINELLNAAALLNGFEVRFFKDGELPLRSDTSLRGIITAYAQELALLARFDFTGAQTTADKFQRLEARVMTKLAIARSVLSGGTGTTTAPNPGNRRVFRRGN